MGRRLNDSLNSRYLEAANRLNSKSSRRRIVAYVESYDDIFFWRTVLGRFEDSTRYFEVMLPSHDTLMRGKKSVLMNFIGNNTGPDMIACVDADYDFLMQGATETSRRILNSPYVFHTYAYSIENLQCYAPSLHDVCVMVTLNDHAIFDFEEFMRQFSVACYPLLVWSVLMYRTGRHSEFSLSNMCQIAELGKLNLSRAFDSIEHLRRKVQRKVSQLQHRYPEAKTPYLQLRKELAGLGVLPENTYLFMQGHHIFDAIVVPVLTRVCARLRLEREQEISRTSAHDTQRRNEMSCYEHSLMDIRAMLKKNMGYKDSPLFARLQQDVADYLERERQDESANVDALPV